VIARLVHVALIALESVKLWAVWHCRCYYVVCP